MRMKARNFRFHTSCCNYYIWSAMAIQLAGQLPVEALQLSPIWRCNILQKYFATFAKKHLQKTHWLKRIRQETYELATTSANTACVKTVCSEVAFAEVPLPAMNPATPSENGFRPDITIQTGSVLIGVSNTASDSLLGKVFEVIGHAR